MYQHASLHVIDTCMSPGECYLLVCYSQYYYKFKSSQCLDKCYLNTPSNITKRTYPSIMIGVTCNYDSASLCATGRG